MRLAIDARFGGIMGGLGTYTRGLVPGLIDALPNIQSIVVIVRDRNEEWLSPLRTNIRCTILEAPRPYSISEQIIVPFLLHRHRVDLLFALHPITPLLCPCATIVTVHDTILHRHYNGASAVKQYLFRWLFKRSVLRSMNVITISTSTTHDLLEEIPGLKRERISMIYPGADTEENADTHQCPACKKPYVIYIGNAKQHKNVQTLIDACTGLPLSLVLVTGGKEISSLRMTPQTVRLQPSPNIPLASFLKNAEALITATLAEGFCLPVIEALRLGTPVIASDLAVLREVTGGYAHFVKPTSDHVRTALQDLIDGKISASEEGKSKALEYTWTRSISAHANILTSLLHTWIN